MQDHSRGGLPEDGGGKQRAHIQGQTEREGGNQAPSRSRKVEGQGQSFLLHKAVTFIQKHNSFQRDLPSQHLPPHRQAGNSSSCEPNLSDARQAETDCETRDEGDNVQMPL